MLEFSQLYSNFYFPELKPLKYIKTQIDVYFISFSLFTIRAGEVFKIVILMNEQITETWNTIFCLKNLIFDF